MRKTFFLFLRWRNGKNKKKKFNNYQNINDNSFSGLWDPQSSSYQEQQSGMINPPSHYVSPSDGSMQQNNESNGTHFNLNAMIHPDRRQNIQNHPIQSMPNKVVTLSKNTILGLTYQVKPNGQHNWVMIKQELVATALNSGVYNIATPQRVKK